LAAVTVAIRTTKAAVDPSTLRPVTFSGGRLVTVAAGGVATSDPVPLAVTRGSDLAVSVAVAGSARVSEHQHGVPTGYCTTARTGDRTTVADGSGFTDAGHPTLVVDDVAVAAGTPSPRTILAVGDSLT